MVHWTHTQDTLADKGKPLPTGSRLVISCRYVENTSFASMDTAVYVALYFIPGGNPGKIKVLIQSRNGRGIEKWESIYKLSKFSTECLTASNPLFRDARLPSAPENAADYAVALQQKSERFRLRQAAKSG